MKRNTSITCLFVFILLFLTVLNTWADGDSATAPEDPTAEEALKQVRDELQDVERRWYLLTRVRWGYPLRFSAGIGAMLTTQPRTTECASACLLRGWHFEVEPGQYGIQGSIGWGRVTGATGRTQRWLNTANWGWAVRGAALRTWRWGPLGPTPQTLVGVEGNLSIVRLNFSAGVMHSLSSQTDDGWVITGALGWGF